MLYNLQSFCPDKQNKFSCLHIILHGRKECEIKT